MKLILQHGEQQLELGDVGAIALKHCCGRTNIGLVGDDIEASIGLTLPLRLPEGQFAEAFARLAGELDLLANFAGGHC